MARTRRGIGLLLVVPLVALVLASCAKSSASTFSGAELHTPYHVPGTRLTDTSGATTSLTSSGKRLTLIFFGYTHCPDECPTTMATLASAVNQLDDADRAAVRVVFVTTDPARDTGPVIRAWLDRFDPQFTGLTGPLPRILKVARQVGVPVEKGNRLPSGGYDMTHGTQVLGMDGKHTVPVVWTLGTTAPEFAHDIHQLLS
ncbi:SCO family protein [Nocardioides cynanchi]|uniref:SCO family protein n=1 Tax=Nocardioides cynanchi TaxID=2558918 RepID=UPI001EE2655A|nr:SCO family protein [Nocardioides cynanchi]